MSAIERMSELLGGRQVLGVDIDSDLGLSRIIARGMDPHAVEALVTHGVLKRAEVERYAIPARTLARRLREAKPLTPDESDRIARYARVAAIAEDTFADAALAGEWLRTSNDALDGALPIELTATEAGARAVETVLSRIVYGDYS